MHHIAFNERRRKTCHALAMRCWNQESRMRMTKHQGKEYRTTMDLDDDKILEDKEDGLCLWDCVACSASASNIHVSAYSNTASLDEAKSMALVAACMRSPSFQDNL